MFDEYALRNSCSLAYDDTKPLVYDGYDDEYNICSSPTIEEENSYDYNMPPAFDDYGDENNYSDESAPTTIAHVGSINSFMHVAHVRDALCDSYCNGPEKSPFRNCLFFSFFASLCIFHLACFC
jgi:hypothetical protein